MNNKINQSLSEETQAAQAAVRESEETLRAAEEAVAAAKAKVTTTQDPSVAQVPSSHEAQAAHYAPYPPYTQDLSAQQTPYIQGAQQMPYVSGVQQTPYVAGVQQTPYAPGAQQMPPTAGAQQAPYAPGAQQAPYPPQPLYGQPVSAAPIQESGQKRGPWSSFPYPLVCVIVFLFEGFLFNMWHPGWIVFLTIPIYYWIAHIIESDPNYQERHR